MLTSDATTYTGLAAKTVSYTFYDDGSRETMVTPAGTFSYEYDACGRMTGLENPNSEDTAWSYLDNGWLHDQTLDNGAVTTYTHNELGEVTDLVTTVGMTSRSSFTSMVYDAAMNRTTLTASIPAHTAYDGETDWTYDTKNQLTQEASARAGGYTENFGYDSAGNPTTWKGASHSFNSNNQDTGNTFDGNGNPTTYQSVGMVYDPEDRLTQVGSTTLTAGYNGDDLRAWKTAASTTTYFLYDGIRPVVELNGSGSVAAVNSFGAYGLVSRHAGSNSTYYTFDPQGSIAQRLDSSGNVLTSQIFDGFGVGSSTGSYSEPFGFCAQWGYYADQETGLALCTYRYQDPGLGRWLNRDPFGYGGGIDLYTYVGNDPVDQIDPLGWAKGKPISQEPGTGPDGEKGWWKTYKDGTREFEPEAECDNSRSGHDRGRNVRPRGGEEHSITGKGNRGVRGGRGARRVCWCPSFRWNPVTGRRMGEGVGWGVVAYWVISEGSRFLFPPRNLVPVP